MELFTPAWNSKHPEKRMDAVRKIKITDLEKLQKIAERTRYEDARQEAWKRIALEAKEWKIRQSAAGKITDEITLAKVALNDGDSDVRKTAMEKVRHPLLLAKIALSEIETLAEAESHYHTLVLAATKGLSALPDGARLLTKEEFLSRVRGNCHSDVRRIAVGKIDDQSVLKKLALKDSDNDVRGAAVERIIDQTILREVALKDSVWGIRKAAVKKITDQAVLKDVALKASDEDVRKAAVEKITDQAVLKVVALKDSDSNVRKTAVKKTTDQAVLKEAALKDQSEYVREAAVEKTSDQAVLKEAMLKDSAYVVRRVAVEKITDQEILREVALKDRDGRICKAAVARISDTQILEQLARNAPEMHVRLDSYGKLPSADPRLAQNLRWIFEERDVGTRKSSAIYLREAFQKNPKAAALFWNVVRERSVVPHKDSHQDNSGKSSDCHNDHSDNNGIGVDFPPYPFKD